GALACRQLVAAGTSGVPAHAHHWIDSAEREPEAGVTPAFTFHWNPRMRRGLGGDLPVGIEDLGVAARLFGVGHVAGLIRDPPELPDGALGAAHPEAFLDLHRPGSLSLVGLAFGAGRGSPLDAGRPSL